MLADHGLLLHFCSSFEAINIPGSFGGRVSSGERRRMCHGFNSTANCLLGLDPLTLHQGKLLALARQGENAPGGFFELFSSCCSLFEDYISSKCSNRALFLCPCKSHQGHLTGRKAFPIKSRELLPSYRTSLWSFYFHFFY